MSKRILYISYDGMTDNLGQSQVLPYLTGLSRLGYTFTIISCEKKDRYQKTKSVIEKICQENNISWEPLFYTKFPPVLSTVKDVLAISRKADSLHKKNPFDLLHCRSYLSAIVGLQMKRRYGIKFLFDMRGLWADERVDGDLWNLKNPVYKMVFKYFKKKEKQFLEQADYTICLTEASKREIHQWKYIRNNPVAIDVIPCCVDTELFNAEIVSQEKKQQIRSDLGISESDFILMYLGGIGLWYLLDEMLDFFTVLSTEIPQAKFLFITTDDNEQILTAAKAKKISSEKIIIAGARRPEVPQYTSVCNASIFFIKPSYSKISSSPTKQGEIMSMGIPVFCNAGVGDTDAVVNKYNSGIVIKEFSEAEYKKSIFTFLNTKFDPESIRKGGIDYFDLEQGVKKYNSVYHKILN